MKYFFIILTFLFLNGCSKQNAFTKFDMTKEEELSASNLQNSKIKLGEKVNGTFSAIYLNKIYPEKFTQNEYFYVYIYSKDQKEIYNPKSFNSDGLTLELNNKLPIEVKELSHVNQFTHLTSIQSRWNKYYIVTFKKEEKKKLNLVLENGQFSSAVLIYQKDE